VVDLYTYDTANELTSITTKSTGKTIGGEKYTYNADSLTSSVTPAYLPTQQYSYNSVNELTKDALGSYTYDPAGNITALQVLSPLNYNAGDELTSIGRSSQGAVFSYNAEGDRTSITVPAAPSLDTNYSYNQLNELTGLSQGHTSASYAYNGDGLRMAKTVNGSKTPFTWDLVSSDPLLLSDGSTSYIYGSSGLPIEEITAAGKTFDYHHDRLGSTTLLTNASGLPVAVYLYDSYGTPLISLSLVSNPLQYTGQYRDAESGLYYLRARYYDPSIGQFTSVDSAVRSTGTSYSYADGNPANVVDPTGMDACANYSTAYGAQYLCESTLQFCSQLQWTGDACHAVGQNTVDEFNRADSDLQAVVSRYDTLLTQDAANGCSIPQATIDQFSNEISTIQGAENNLRTIFQVIQSTINDYNATIVSPLTLILSGIKNCVLSAGAAVSATGAAIVGGVLTPFGFVGFLAVAGAGCAIGTAAGVPLERSPP